MRVKQDELTINFELLAVSGRLRLRLLTKEHRATVSFVEAHSI